MSAKVVGEDTSKDKVDPENDKKNQSKKDETKKWLRFPAKFNQQLEALFLKREADKVYTVHIYCLLCDMMCV